MQAVDRPTGIVTFLFTDIEGSSQSWDSHHDAMAAALARHDEIERDAIEQEGGYVFSTGGDGLAAAFQSPASAIRSAVAIQRGVQSEEWPSPLRIRVRMGINSGTAVEREGDYFGPAVIRAARLMSLVSGGRIACAAETTESVRADLSDELEFHELGTVRLRGLGVDETVFVIGGNGLSETGEPLADPRHQLRPAPAPIGRFIGRAAELDELCAVVVAERFVTVVGLGGMGKTRLAVEVAASLGDKFPDGVAWVELAATQHRDAAVHEIASALGVRPQVGEDVLVTAIRALSARRLLLVLDNCEHIRSDVASLVREIGSSGAAATILATSRERLGVEGERVITVGPLDDGVELFLERFDVRSGRSADPESLEAARLIVEQVDGIPLAIELAAARCRTLGVTDVASRMSSELTLLADHRRTDPRQRTLEQVIAWSFDLLDDNERSVLQRLSVCGGAFTLDTAERIASNAELTAAESTAAISNLVEHSLLIRVGGRFRLLEPTRQYAYSRLQGAGEAELTADRHLSTIVERIDGVRMGLLGANEAHWVDELDADWPDVRVAISRALDTDSPDEAITLVTGLALEAFLRRPEVFGWIVEVQRRWGDRPGPLRAALLGAASQVAWTTLDVERSVDLAAAALALEPEPGASLSCLPQTGAIGALNYSSQSARAATVAREALDRHGDDMLPAIRVCLLASEATSLMLAGDPQADGVVDQAIMFGERVANPSWLGYALFTRALIHELRGGDPIEASLARDRARVLAESVSNHWLLMMCASTQPTFSGHDHPATDVGTMLDSMDDLLQTGWSTHAWGVGWLMPSAVARLGDDDLAATWLGACVASGHPRFNMVSLSAELEAALERSGDPKLIRCVEAGERTTFAELRRRTLAVTGAS